MKQVSPTKTLISVAVVLAMAVSPLLVRAESSAAQPPGVSFSWVSRSLEADLRSGWHGVAPSIAYDGRSVVFLSESSDLVSGDTNRTYDAFVKDLRSGVVERVSVANDGSQLNFGVAVDYGPPIMSSNGRYVAFPFVGRTNRVQVYVRDRLTNTTHEATTNSDGSPLATSASALAISDSGLVLLSAAGSEGQGNDPWTDRLLLKSLGDGSLRPAPFTDPTGQGHSWQISAKEGSLSADGSTLVIYAADKSAAAGPNEVLAVQLANGSTTLVSPVTSGSTRFVFGGVSRSGRYVLFASDDPTLLDPDIQASLYMRDLTTGQLVPIDPLPQGRTWLGAAQRAGATISDDGRLVGFLSEAYNLDESYTAPSFGYYYSAYIRDTVAQLTRAVVARIAFSPVIPRSGPQYSPQTGAMVFMAVDPLDAADSAFNSIDTYLASAITEPLPPGEAEPALPTTDPDPAPGPSLYKGSDQSGGVMSVGSDPDANAPDSELLFFGK